MFLQSRTKSFPRSLAVLNHLCVDGVYLSEDDVVVHVNNRCDYKVCIHQTS